ncbi:hypothetical protein QNI19_21260 [Cytophagaceae bacterium DM2B3-1]|uniref:Uncharacterized protein n=1 Tax=Xanthocytophaga flava TaxID=3048013 RepID=A0ABT7CP23_9BACT|nr:hypothetical protein [Xanthocytophaga flavus]MDJ1495482.1 hypothetical protein [Xanthocytophaga flavus]
MVSTQPLSTWREPLPTKTGRGAHKAISSCESTGRSLGVSGPAYLLLVDCSSETLLVTCKPSFWKDYVHFLFSWTPIRKIEDFLLKVDQLE